MPSPAASSARGGRSSAPNTEDPDRRAVNRLSCTISNAESSSCFRVPSRSTIQCAPVTPAALRDALARVPAISLASQPTPVEPLRRLAAVIAIGGGARLLVKRDDAIAFGFGGNKVRKLALVAARARADGADTLITAGGVQSNHARATAATAAKLGMRAVLVANGRAPQPLTANALLDHLLGAEVCYVASREARAPMIVEISNRLRAQG